MLFNIISSSYDHYYRWKYCGRTPNDLNEVVYDLCERTGRGNDIDDVTAVAELRKK